MGILNSVTYIEAHKKNFNQNVRSRSSIKYIVIHYTSNIGDTARNNALYFHEEITNTSAHFFVSDDSVYQTVPINHAAYAVGLGSMKEPYVKWPLMWKKITNSNSISIELCGSKTSREASEETKRTAAKLTAELLKQLNLTPQCVYRHFDVTGKACPAWAVEDPLKWLDFTLRVNNEFYEEGEDAMKDTPENYELFKTWMKRYQDEIAAIPADWDKPAMQYCEQRGLIKDGRAKSNITRGELATVLMRLNV